MWFRPDRLKDLFSRLYSISEDKDKVIELLGFWSDKKWEWFFNWRRTLFVWEQEVLSEFFDTICVTSSMGSQNDVGSGC